MDVATAARMSDPELNRHFRRRWVEANASATFAASRGILVEVGPIGLALIEAWRRKQRMADSAVDPALAALAWVTQR